MCNVGLESKTILHIHFTRYLPSLCPRRWDHSFRWRHAGAPKRRKEAFSILKWFVWHGWRCREKAGLHPNQCPSHGRQGLENTRGSWTPASDPRLEPAFGFLWVGRPAVLAYVQWQDTHSLTGEPFCAGTALAFRRLFWSCSPEYSIRHPVCWQMQWLLHVADFQIFESTHHILSWVLLPWEIFILWAEN